MPIGTSASDALDTLVEKVSGGDSGAPESIFWQKHNRRAGVAISATVASCMQSFWTWDGNPCAGAVPTTAAVPNNTTAGGLLQTDPGGSLKKWLLGGWGSAQPVPGCLMLYDRLLHCGGLDATVATAQTVGGTLTRYTDGIGNMACVEIYTQIGVTAQTISMSYTDQDGNSGQVPTSTQDIGGSGLREQCLLWPIPILASDEGVRSVETITLGGSTGTAGDFGITIIHPLAFLGCGGPVGPRPSSFDWIVAGGPPEIKTDACLALAWIGATTPPRAMGQFNFIDA